MATTHPPQLRVLHGGAGAGALTESGQDELGDPPRRWRHAEGALAGYCVAAAATAGAVAAGGTRHPLVALVVLAFALLAAARRMSLAAALASGGMAWLYYDGFIIGRHAQLVWEGTRGAWWLLALAAAAACGSAIGRYGRHQHG